ncbi:MAG: hypothetical protein Q4G14_09335 [Paracoccus sp. (in: a-proteobacteria)]|uniref:hypothetical protein n=1 Tax=Paracoccus sp. TaxID=267 RepID=UPI0026DF8859|nr:hypothetical protein [Paracoccus sp. (in: a-proteobacteria)]MDO5613427.1 hypothetical protein [Paracoccus sp. (in: a-proteobacteria)]
MMKLTAPLLIVTMAAAGCGRLGDSAGSLNPLRWMGSGAGVRTATLEPEGGYRSTTPARPGIAQITGASWQPISEGRLLVVTGIAPTKGYSGVALVAETPDPTGRLRPDADGVLRLRMVANPPQPGTTAAATPANPAVDTITAAVAIPNVTLARLRQVSISGAGNTVTLNR